MKKREKKEIRTDMWMNTMTDMTQLLLCFFIFLMSIASFDQNKLKDFFSAAGGVFGTGGASGAGVLTSGADISSDPGGMSTGREPNENKLNSEDYIRSGADTPGTGNTQAIKVSAQTTAQFTKTVKEIQQQEQAKDIKAEVTAEGLRITLLEGYSKFSSGSPDLPADASQRLTGLIDSQLKPYAAQGYEVVVEGHTDNVPLSSRSQGRFKDNRGLSSERANNVLRLFERVGVPPENISAAGYGEHRPAGDNAAEQGRSQNRRIEILIKYKELSPKEVTPE